MTNVEHVHTLYESVVRAKSTIAERIGEHLIRRKIHSALQEDEISPMNEFLLHDYVLHATRDSRSQIEIMIAELAQAQDIYANGGFVELYTLVKETESDNTSVLLQRIMESSGPCYIIYEIREDKKTQEITILSHALIDIDKRDVSQVNPNTRTDFSWKAKQIDSRTHPRAAVTVFNALVTHVMYKVFRNNPSNVVLAGTISV